MGVDVADDGLYPAPDQLYDFAQFWHRHCPCRPIAQGLPCAGVGSDESFRVAPDLVHTLRDIGSIDRPRALEGFLQSAVIDPALGEENGQIIEVPQARVAPSGAGSDL